MSGLALLRRRIREANVAPPRRDNLRVATWNIRALGKARRTDESIRILATIVAAFDVVAIVELRDDVTDLRRVLHALGPHWDHVYSDTIRDAGGNHERAAFVFDTRRVGFGGLASNAEGPRRRVGDGYVRTVPWWRPPFVASFEARGRDFVIVTTHVRWGASMAAREQEVGVLATWLADRAGRPYFRDKDLLAVGDFNLGHRDGRGLQPLRARGFVSPELPAAIGTNLARDKRYDEVLLRARSGATFRGAGAVDFYCGDGRALFRRPGRMTKEAFTWQVSDHLPVWAEVGW